MRTKLLKQRRTVNSGTEYQDNRPYESKTRKTGNDVHEEVPQNIHFLYKAARNCVLGKGILNFLVFKCSLITVTPLIIKTAVRQSFYGKHNAI